MTSQSKITIEQYLDKLSKFAGSEYGRMVRKQFADIKGSSELAMLASPTKDELEQLRRAVAIMTADEKAKAGELTDEQIQKIANDAGTEAGRFAIFINGYSLHCRKNR